MVLSFSAILSGLQQVKYRQMKEMQQNCISTAGDMEASAEVQEVVAC